MTKSNYYRLKYPKYDTDYQYIKINGKTEGEYHFPGVDCDICKQKWGGSERININDVLIFKNIDKKKFEKFKPKNLDKKNLWNVPINYFYEMLSDIFGEANIEKYKEILRPGSEFGTRTLDIKYIPINSFLFPKPWTYLITEDVLNLLKKYKVKDFSYLEVIIKNDSLKFNQKIYEIFINKKIPILNFKVNSICKKCGRREITQVKSLDKIIINCQSVQDEDIFRGEFHPGYIFVTERLKDILIQNKVNNIDFEQIYCADD